MFRYVTVGLLTFAITTSCYGHPVSVTEATVYVQREKITATIGIFVEDLYLFQKLKPNKDNYLEPADLEQAKERHGKFLLERVIIRDATGEALKGRVVKIDGFEMPAKGISLDEVMTYSYSYQ